MHQSRLAFNNHIIPRRLPKRTRLSIPSNTRINKPRVNLPAILPAQTHLRQLPRDEVLNEDVRLGDEFVEDGETLGFLEVDGEGAFVAVDGEEVGGLGGEVGGWCVGYLRCGWGTP